MSKLVKLRIGKATADNSYQVLLQISQKQRSQLDPIEVNGELPIPSKLLQAHQDWRKTYDRLDLFKREGEVELDTDLPANISIDERIEECKNAGKNVITLFNSWLESGSFTKIRESLQKELGSMDEIQTFLQIDESLPELARLPWQETHFFKRELLTEVALIKQNTNEIKISSLINSQVKILAVLGNSKKINIEEDRKILESSGAYVRYLEKPNQQSLYNALSKEQWDIFFFAGHSSSIGAEGEMYVNDLARGLTFEDISNAVNTAVKNGLKIAILNSCDGLKLGKSLSELQVPQIIFMREPVPDIVAHMFIKEFVDQYSAKGKSFYSSVRYARKELQSLQGEFPCATWLPTIYQSSTNYPPNWAQLMAPPEPLPEPLLGPVDTRKFYLSRALLTGLIATIAITAARLTGILEPLELKALDFAMILRPPEKSVDSKILVIEVTKKDSENEVEKSRLSKEAYSSLSNDSLNRILQKIKPYQSIIGVDIILDRDIGSQYTFIHEALKSNDLVPACVTPGGNEGNEIKPPDESHKSRMFGFADVTRDGNENDRLKKIVRRHLLSMNLDKLGKFCNQNYAFSFMLAYQYLHTKGQKLEIIKNSDDVVLKIGEKKYPILTDRSGGYKENIDQQILLNYRSIGEPNSESITKAISSISLGDFMKKEPDELKKLVQGKLIIIGTEGSFSGDLLTTPYGIISGVFLQAQMASQLINAGSSENRPLIMPYPFWGDILIIFFTATTIGLLLSLLKHRWLFLVVLTGGIFFIIFSSVKLLERGQWFPVVPTLIVVLFSGGTSLLIDPLLETKIKSLSSNTPVTALTK